MRDQQLPEEARGSELTFRDRSLSAKAGNALERGLHVEGDARDGDVTCSRLSGDCWKERESAEASVNRIERCKLTVCSSMEPEIDVRLICDGGEE